MSCGGGALLVAEGALAENILYLYGCIRTAESPINPEQQMAREPKVARVLLAARNVEKPPYQDAGVIIFDVHGGARYGSLHRVLFHLLVGRYCGYSGSDRYANHFALIMFLSSLVRT